MIPMKESSIPKLENIPARSDNLVFSKANSLLCELNILIEVSLPC